LDSGGDNGADGSVPLRGLSRGISNSDKFKILAELQQTVALPITNSLLDKATVANVSASFNEVSSVL
jgi:hypothetical protein